MKIKIPNILTIGRIIIVPIFVFTFFLPGFSMSTNSCLNLVIADKNSLLLSDLTEMFKQDERFDENKTTDEQLADSNKPKTLIKKD